MDSPAIVIHAILFSAFIKQITINGPKERSGAKAQNNGNKPTDPRELKTTPGGIYSRSIE